MLYKQVWPGVLKYVRRNSGDSEQAEDAFHDGVLKIITIINDGGMDPSTDIKAYLFSVCRNNWIAKSRRDTRIKLTDTVPEDVNHQESSFGSLLNDEKVAAMEQMLTSIGEKCKELLKLTFYMDYSLEEAAKMLGISNAGVAKTNQYRCKKKLFEKIESNVGFKDLMGIS